MSSIAVTGVVGSDIRTGITSNNTPVSSFRLAVTARRFDQTSGKWVDGSTSWFTVAAYGQLAINVQRSLLKGQRVNVIGDLKVVDWNNGDRSGTAAEINANAVGHDLMFGTAEFHRTMQDSRESAPEASSQDKGDEEKDAVASEAPVAKQAKPAAPVAEALDTPDGETETPAVNGFALAGAQN